MCVVDTGVHRLANKLDGTGKAIRAQNESQIDDRVRSRCPCGALIDFISVAACTGVATGVATGWCTNTVKP